MTPALLVPDTPEGKLYKQLPLIMGKIAGRAHEQAAQLNLISAVNGWMTEGAAEHLHLLLLNQLAGFEFSAAQDIGAAGMVRWLNQMPLFTWNPDIPQVQGQFYVPFTQKDGTRIRKFNLPFQEREPGLFAAHPTIAYGYLGKMPNYEGVRGYINEGGGVCFAVYHPHHGVLFSKGLIQTTALALRIMFERLEFDANWNELIADKTPRVADNSYMGQGAWALLDEFAIIERKQGSRGQIYVTATVNPAFALATVFPWPANFANQPLAIVKPLTELASKVESSLAKQQRMELLQFGAAVLTIAGIGLSINAIASQGAGFANVAKLIGSLDNLPGIDLGAVGDVAKGISGGINLANTIPGGVNMFEFEDVNLGDFNVGEFAGDIELTFEDIGVNVSPDFDFSIFDDYGLEAGDLLGDEFGNIFTVAGDAVTLSPEDYIKTIYVDESGNYRDFSNNVVLSQPEADYIFNESGADNDAVFEEIATRASMLSGNSFVSMEGSANRPAGTPSPAAQVQVPMFTQVSDALLSWVKTLTSYSLAKEQLEKTGRYTSPYATNPQGQSYSQVPGVPVRRADGSIVTNNGNGTQTVQFADGRVQTLPTNFSASGAMGGQLIAGVSNQTLLLAGAGVLAALLIARR